MRNRRNLLIWIATLLSAVGVFLLVVNGQMMLGLSAAVAVALFGAGRRACRLGPDSTPSLDPE
ncbi:hypothetical protein [Symbiobacterium thermophilum]|uniref:Uncharacterized protein n=2 Tax=Symbiobacterium thermophilum TaxID=2734 RepID=Q67SD0_SYMTH|nr:hypothetical protein [Symbiobacterium thermophilum]MBY6277241.1 hypothetical protein [Symbiobacterium thermophilum]OTA40953.1 MAG: hypothetical protein A6D92_11570 [Symbiobacterium thermophilum]BAD39413.1 hypothetical protein STH428 [Symbiobacterium thermophilum IAM 14863]